MAGSGICCWISKSGTPILPSKRARKIPEKISTVAPEKVLEEQINTEDNSIDSNQDLSIDELKEQEAENNEKVDEVENS